MIQAPQPFYAISLALALITMGIFSVGLSPHHGPAEIAVAASTAVEQKPKLLFDESELPGRYYFGDGLGVNCSVELRRDHRFDFAWHGCLGEYDRNYGKWALDGDTIVLHPERPNVCEGFQGMNVRFVPVKWGQRHYLVDENQMPGFCADARGRTPPTERIVHGDDYIKLEPVRRASSGAKPIVPQRFKEFYEKGPIRARVIRIDDDRVTLNKGSLDRLRPGMILALTRLGLINLEVVSVSNHEARARPIYFWNSESPVKVGDEFTTGEGFRRPHGTGFRRLPSPPTRKNRP